MRSRVTASSERCNSEACYVAPVVEPEVALHAGEQHEVGLAQRLAALVTQQ